MSWTASVMDVFNPEAHEPTIFHRMWTPRPPGPDFITSSVNTSVNTAASCFSYSNYSLAAQIIKESNEMETQIYAREEWAKENLPGNTGRGSSDLRSNASLGISLADQSGKHNTLSEDHSGRRNYRSFSWASSFRVLQKKKTVKRGTGGVGSSKLLVWVCPWSP